jgi:eukaryotic-like serine/threonine-protein kinase
MATTSLKPGRRHLVSFESGHEYRIEELIGQGGFGTVYRGQWIRAGKPTGPPVCIKTTVDVSSWHREAYFGEILRGHAGAVQMQSSFVGHQGPRRPLYCSVFELCERSIADVPADGLRWTEAKIVREFRAVVRAVSDLHAGGAVHRDITPRNVLLTFDGHLKLADFGIALHGIARKVPADAFNPWHAPDTVLGGKQDWSPRDDVWQLGQLFAHLLGFNGTRWLRSVDVRKLSCSDRCKALIYRCIARAEHRFRDGGHLLREMSRGSRFRFSRITSVAYRTVVFTGRGTMKRSQLWRLAKRAGAEPVARVSRGVDIVVVGGRSPIWAAGAAGRKILAALQLVDDGHRIRFVKESRFLHLAGKRRRRP